MKLLKKSVIAAAIALACTGAQALDTTLTNGSITAVINDGGTFSTSWFGGPAPGTPGLSWTGTEFVNIDNTSSWWRLTSTTPLTDVTAQYNSNPVGSVTSGGPIVSTTLTGTLSFLQVVSLTSADQISFSVQLHNTGSTAITGVEYGVGIDPDQGGSGKNTTLNTILGQSSAASVRAWDTLYGTNKAVTLANTTSASAFAIRAYINSGDCCSAVLPATALAGGQAVSFSTLADDSISLAYNIGTIGVGETVTIGYNYTFTTPIPEPETYAMMLAGLGLMGFIARRRKQNAAA